MMNEEINVKDSMRGVVDWCSDKGVYLYLENGHGAYATFSALPKGTEVFCTVLKKPTQRFLTLVAIDAVLGQSRIVA